MEKIKTDVVVVGTGAAGLYHALHLPKELQICMITKDEVDRSDSFFPLRRNALSTRESGT